MSVASMLNGNVSKVFSFVENRAIYAVFRKCVMSTNKAKQLDDGRRTVIITGSNRGIGLAAVKELAATNKWNIVMACRSIEQAQAAKETIVNGAENVIVAHLDLADLSSIDQFVKDWGSKTIDCLALNAGVHSGNRKTPLRTKDGFEMTVGTNHIGHFHLTTQLVENVKKSEDGRIVFVASSVHDSKKAPTSDPTSSMLGTLQGLEAGFQGEHSMVSGRPYNSEQAYKDSKLCNVMIALELARRLKAENVPVTCNCFAPGLIPTTGLFREYNAYALYVFDFFMRHVLQLAVTEEEGGRRLAHMIGSPELEGVTGAYFARNAKTGLFEAVSPSAEALDTDKAAKLWMVTDRLLHNRK